MNDPHWIEAMTVMVSDFLSGWAGKVSLGTTIAFACEMLHVDYGLAVLCFCMLTADIHHFRGFQKSCNSLPVQHDLSFRHNAQSLLFCST